MIEAFGGVGTPSALAGGRGTAWRAGRLVLRPADPAEPPLAWQRDMLGSIGDAGFRVSLPLTTPAGDFEKGGWCAWQFVEGAHDKARWPEIIAVGERFGIIRFGSRVDVFLPREATPRVAVGQTAVAGETVIAEFGGSPATPLVRID